MQLILSDARHTADEDLETLELLLTPPPASATVTQGSSASNGVRGAHQPLSAAQALYAAVSACADLHPDPASESEDGGPDGAGGFGVGDGAGVGAGGWITAENMHEFMDEEGILRMPEGENGDGVGVNGGGAEVEELGAGAGRRRGLGEMEDGVDGGHGAAVDGEEDGGHGETKWRRTG